MYGWMHKMFILFVTLRCVYLASYNFGNAHYNSSGISGKNKVHNYIIKQITVLKTSTLKIRVHNRCKEIRKIARILITYILAHFPYFEKKKKGGL
jgi:hypothetical protein